MTLLTKKPIEWSILEWIKYLGRIATEKWTINMRHDFETGSRCVLGHIDEKIGYHGTGHIPGISSIELAFVNNGRGNEGAILPIGPRSKWLTKQYHSLPTPKERSLAFLQDCADKISGNTSTIV